MVTRIEGLRTDDEGIAHALAPRKSARTRSTAVSSEMLVVSSTSYPPSRASRRRNAAQFIIVGVANSG
jgi:hypothetical protein